MTLIQAWKFVKALNKLLFHYEAIGRNFGFMLAFTALYSALRYFSSLHPDQIVAFCIFGLCFYQIFQMEWLNYRLRCPQCGGRFFMAFSPIGPVHERQSCQKCRVPLGEIEVAAREKIERIQRGLNPLGNITLSRFKLERDNKPGASGDLSTSLWVIIIFLKNSL